MSAVEWRARSRRVAEHDKNDEGLRHQRERSSSTFASETSIVLPSVEVTCEKRKRCPQRGQFSGSRPGSQTPHGEWRANNVIARWTNAANQAWAIEIGITSYDRILLCDELGDHYHEGPHLLVEYLDGQPFEGFMRWIEPNNNYFDQRLWTPDESKRLTLFPKPIPDEREQWYEEMRTKSDERSRTGRP